MPNIQIFLCLIYMIVGITTHLSKSSVHSVWEDGDFKVIREYKGEILVLVLKLGEKSICRFGRVVYVFYQG